METLFRRILERKSRIRLSFAEELRRCTEAGPGGAKWSVSLLLLPLSLGDDNELRPL